MADTTVEDLCDWEKMCAVIADTEPWWEPGTKTGYHPQTFGYIAGEVVRRPTGKPISQVLREDVAAPLGVADELFLAVGESELAKITAVAMTGADEILQFPSSRALGYDVGFPGPLDSPTLFGMAGSGGTAAYADTATGVAVAVTKNRVTYGEFNAFNQVGDIVTKALDGR
jgi:CubicO group peptidase (beta-lactamase class C family)